MNFLNKMERRFGRYALTNLSLYIVLTYAAGYLLYMITPQVLTYMTLEPAMILRGQVWRIVSWLLIPPSTQNIFFILITLMFYYSIGTSLERTWGAFRYNVYIFSGILMTIIGAFILNFVLAAMFYLADCSARIISACLSSWLMRQPIRITRCCL